jgi:hypothetical protein
MSTTAPAKALRIVDDVMRQSHRSDVEQASAHPQYSAIGDGVGRAISP